jgi:allantoinase
VEPGAVADLVVRGRRVVMPDGVRPAAVHVAGGRIAAVTGLDQFPGDVQIVDAEDLVVLPGLVDTHVHVNEPGRTDWEGFESATRAAAAGGTTTIVDMPLNSIPPTTTAAALAAKRDAASGGCAVDVAFWGGVVPGNEGRLAELVDAGVCGFKAFMIDSGVPEFPPLDRDGLARAMAALARLGRPLLVHAELPEPMAAAQSEFAALPAERRRHYEAFLASRPSQAEDEAIALLARLTAETGARVHVVHLASGPAVDVIRTARAAGAKISAETCPHYLTVTAEEVADGATAFKCCPPIREAAHRDALWAGLADGTIEMIVSDHSPSPPELKALTTGDFGDCWGGIASLELRLPVVWTEARRRGIALERLAEWLAAAPARLAGLAHRKGAIAPGADADLVLFDPDAEFVADAAALAHRHPVTPYHGRRLAGRVHSTILRGEVVYTSGRHHSPRHGREVS